MSARVLVLATRSAAALAAKVAAALDAAGTRAEVALPDPRPQLDASELVVALLDGAASRSPRVQQALGYALARHAPVLVAARGARDVGLLAGAAVARWPGGVRSLAALVTATQRALPATPRAAARSLANTNDARWHVAIEREVEAELAARGWEPRSMASERAFMTSSPERVWRKRIGDMRVHLRPRVAPFNPVDLLHVREPDAARVFEWWVLRDSRPDAWMRRVYRGASEKLTARTKYFGTRDPAPSASRGGILLSQRFLTQRVDRTGEMTAELAGIEAWIAARTAPLVA